MTNISKSSKDTDTIKLPVPYPDPVAWDTNLQAALDSDPRRKTNYERYLKAQKSIDVDYLPTRLDIENVSRCNYRCTMCQVSDWGPSYQRAGDMSFEDFKRVVDENYGLLEIKLQGMGEPLLGRDTYFEMIRYARSKHIWVRSTNNGSLLHFKNNFKKLIDSGINEVQVSIDGATKDTFESIRQGSKFELVVANCKLLNGYCDELGVLRTRMWTVLQRKNLGEIFELVDLAHEMGFPRLTFNRDLTTWGQERWALINQEMNVEDEISLEVAHEAIGRGRSLGVEVTFWASYGKYSTRSPDTICPWPFEKAYISSDMRVVPCCFIADPKVADLGDAHNFVEVWQSESYKEFRRAHLEGRIPKVCQACYEQNNGTPA